LTSAYFRDVSDYGADGINAISYLANVVLHVDSFLIKLRLRLDQSITKIVIGDGAVQ
jgi:hypothetical protein